jgi:protein gp37
MAKNSLIEWTQSTWNPWHGCIKVSPGCKNCYMYRDKKRYGQNPAEILRSKTTFYDPMNWVEPRLIFTCSWSDWFVEQADTWRDEAWQIIRDTPQHTYQILTKRPERIAECLPNDWDNGWNNVWLGVSIENQKYIFRKEILTTIPSKVRFISAEPLLGSIDFGSLDNIHWVITGGESGPEARPMDINWVKSIREQCLRKKIPFFHKQNGGTKLVDGVWGGRSLDGKVWDEMPAFA